MKIALIGYGKMGVEVEKIALERGHEVTLKLNSKSQWNFSELKNVQVAIEFTTPQAAVQNITSCIHNGIPVVTGSTGWYNRLGEVTNLCEKQNGTLLYATNFSLGVNLFFAINAFIADKLNTYGGYHVNVHEIHHTAKLDAPSGTAITTAETLVKHMAMYTGWKHTETPSPGEIPVTHQRKADIPGTHSTVFKGDDDKIEVTHTAFNRRGFALGAVLAAEWVHLRKGIYTMRDVLGLSY